MVFRKIRERHRLATDPNIEDEFPFFEPPPAPAISVDPARARAGRPEVEPRHQYDYMILRLPQRRKDKRTPLLLVFNVFDEAGEPRRSIPGRVVIDAIKAEGAEGGVTLTVAIPGAAPAHVRQILRLAEQEMRREDIMPKGGLGMTVEDKTAGEQLIRGAITY